MRVLYLCYGTHSGIVTSHVTAMRGHGVEMERFDAAANFNYRMEGRRLPSFQPANLINTLIAMKRYGREWRWFYRRTDFAFRWMSRNASRFWLANERRFDAVMQSGALFHGAPPKRLRELPFLMHLDHTYAISKRSVPIEGVRDSRPASPRWEVMERETYQDADHIFTMSEYVRQSLLLDYDLETNRTTVLGGGPNLPALPHISPHESCLPVVLFVGKDFPRKGGPVLLEAFARVRAETPSAELWIAGPLSVPQQDGVRCLGLLAHEEMPSVYAQSSVFVMPSLREPYGIAFIEAMAYGLPCVGTRIEAIPEIIDDGKTGLIVPPGDSVALASAVSTLLKNEKLAQSMGGAGRKKVEQILNWNRVTAKMALQIEAVIKIKGRR